ncbi:hypothetical protein ACQKEI_12115 [Psychrobacter namhaensis]|uniref:hypothetical protein n=1 Tax=Psychrobacter namhaensis TaxID=292734 RepID=UPI003D035592
MYTVRVLSEIDDRLDAEYYNPEALVTINKMETKGSITTFGSLVSEGYRVVYHGTDSTNGLKDNETLPFLSPTQIDKDGAISFENTDRLPIYYKDKYPKGLGSVGEILVEVKGNVSKVGIIPRDFPKNLMISGSLYKATLDATRADSHYILAFLKSKHGQTLKNRLTSNTIINYIAKDALYSIPIIELNAITQKYIGDKVRQAEELRAWAKELESEIEQVLNTSEYLVACNTPDTKISHPTLNDLSNRLDPKYYDSKAIAVERFTKKSGTLLGSLIKSIANGFEERNFVNEGVPYITVTEVSSGRLNVQDAPQIGSDISIPSKAIIHERCVLVVRTGSIGTAIKVNILDKGCVISSHLIRLEFEEEETAAAVSVFLNSTAGKILLHKISYGAVQPQIGQEELLALYIPDYVLNKKTTCLTLLENYELTTRASKSLIRTAKTLVEALIEGQLTEGQLIKAQQALEDGDNTLDKAILSKLSSEGYAVEGATPLFSDIDELYSLLASATAAADSED